MHAIKRVSEAKALVSLTSLIHASLRVCPNKEIPMKGSPTFSTVARSLFFVAVILIIATALFAASAWNPESTQERPVWDVQMQSNARASSNITIQNQCQQSHTF